jgi:hypothetical protein
MTRTTRRNFLGKLLGTATAAVIAPKLFAKGPPGEVVLGVLRRGEQTFPINKGTFVCSGAFYPELDRVPFDATTYRGAGEVE